MHEMALMAGVFDLIKENIAGYPVTKVNSVKLKVGKLTNVVPEAMELAFEAFAKGTVIEGAHLEIERVPLVVGCRDCHQESSLDEFVFMCPSCGSSKVDLISGRELYLDSLEVETDGD